MGTAVPLIPAGIGVLHWNAARATRRHQGLDNRDPRSLAVPVSARRDSGIPSTDVGSPLDSNSEPRHQLV